MMEFGRIDVPESAKTLESSVTQKSLQVLIELSFMFEKIRKQKKNKMILSFYLKRDMALDSSS